MTLEDMITKTVSNSLNMMSYCTCKPDFDQIQGVKHKRWHHTSAESRHQVFYLYMTEDLLDMSGYWESRTRSAGHGTVIRSRAHVYW